MNGANGPDPMVRMMELVAAMMAVQRRDCKITIGTPGTGGQIEMILDIDDASDSDRRINGAMKQLVRVQVKYDVSKERSKRIREAGGTDGTEDI